MILSVRIMGESVGIRTGIAFSVSAADRARLEAVVKAKRNGDVYEHRK